MATTTHSSIYISRPSNYEGDGTDDKEEFIETCNIRFKDMFKDQKSISTLSEIEKKYLENTENGTNGDHITNGVIIVLFSIIIAAFIYLIFSFVSGIWISIKY